jgi:hypothetical protein
MEGGATGLEYARAALGAEHEVVLAHALPDRIRIEVQDGHLVASADDLHDDARSTPMARLRIDGLRVTRENIWPTEQDLGLPVILPGGEAGILRSWWNDEDATSWRWTLELTGPSA